MDPRRTSWPAVFLAVGAGIVAAFQVGKVPISLPAIRADLGIDLAAASWILSLFACLGAGFGAVMGSAITRLGARRMLPLGLGLLALASLAGSVAPSLGLLLFSRMVEGIAFMVVVIAAPALITLLTRPQDRQTAFGVWGCFMPFGMALAMMGAPALPLLGWRGLWLTMAGLLALYAVLVQLRMPHPVPPPPAPPGHPLRDLGATLRAPGPLRLGLVFATYSAAYAVLTGFLPTLLIERMGVPPAQAGLLTALVAGANVLGNLATGPLLRRGVARWKPMVMANLTIALASVGIFSGLLPHGATYGLCLAFSAVGGMLPGCVLGSAPLVAPERRLVPVTLGLFMQGSSLGQLVGPVAAGLAVSTLGWPAAALVLAPMALAGAWAALSLRKRVASP